MAWGDNKTGQVCTFASLRPVRFECGMTTYELMDDPTDGQIHPIRKGLWFYNRTRLGSETNDPYARLLIYARDDAGNLIGGVFGEAYWGWLHVDTLWVAEAQRGHDIGSMLLMQIEQAAAERGFPNSHVKTTDFQALAFYQKNGYEVFGTLENKPPGHTWYYLKKVRAGA
jgi:GNAT superfamily N-acetyltransferase